MSNNVYLLNDSSSILQCSLPRISRESISKINQVQKLVIKLKCMKEI
jgi:hypothetical protein